MLTSLKASAHRLHFSHGCIFSKCSTDFNFVLIPYLETEQQYPLATTGKLANGRRVTE